MLFERSQLQLFVNVGDRLSAKARGDILPHCRIKRSKYVRIATLRKVESPLMVVSIVRSFRYIDRGRAHKEAMLRLLKIASTSRMHVLASGMHASCKTPTIDALNKLLHCIQISDVVRSALGSFGIVFLIYYAIALCSRKMICILYQ